METNYRRALLSALWEDVKDVPGERLPPASTFTRTGAEMVSIKGPRGDVMVCCLLVNPQDVVIDDGLARELQLSPTQARVACLLAARRTNKEIASLMGIAESTVRGHTEAVFMRLGVRSRLQVESRIARAFVDAR